MKDFYCKFNQVLPAEQRIGLRIYVFRTHLCFEQAWTEADLVDAEDVDNSGHLRLAQAYFDRVAHSSDNQRAMEGWTIKK